MTKRTIIMAMAAIFVIGSLFVPFMDQMPFSGKETAVSEPTPEERASQFHMEGADEPADINLANLPSAIATVNGIEIESEIYSRIISNVKAEFERSGEVLTQEKFDTINKGVMDNLVNTEILYQESKAGNYISDDEEVNAKLQEIKSQFGSEEDFKKALAQGNTTEESLKEEIRKSNMIDKLVEERVVSQVKVSEEKAREYYEENEQAFSSPPTRKTFHILMNLDKNADEKTTGEVRKRMEEVLREIKIGEDFEELAKKNSEGPSAVDGGNLGFVPRGMMVKEFEEAAFELKEGGVSPIIRTQFGLHIIKVTEIKEAGLVEFAKIQKEILRNLEIKQRNILLKDYISGLREKADIRITM